MHLQKLFKLTFFVVASLVQIAVSITLNHLSILEQSLMHHETIKCDLVLIEMAIDKSSDLQRAVIIVPFYSSFAEVMFKKAWMNNANCFILLIGEAVSINDMVELKRMIPSEKPVGVIYEVKREWNNIILNLISRSWPWPLSTILRRKNGVQNKS